MAIRKMFRNNFKQGEECVGLVQISSLFPNVKKEWCTTSEVTSNKSLDFWNLKIIFYFDEVLYVVMNKA